MRPSSEANSEGRTQIRTRTYVGLTQRPSDVESTVLSQCNSWIILRLTHGSDQDHGRRLLPDSLAGFTKLLSALGRREALIVGEAAALPARIRIRDLAAAQLPDSNDISFAGVWAHAPNNAAAVEPVLTRWTR
jgi:DNA helicase HerA-like ATPase